MYRLHGFIDKPGVDGGAFMVDRVDKDSVIEFLEKSCDEGSLLLVSIEEPMKELTASIRKNLGTDEFKDVFTWHAYVRGLCPSGSACSDNIVHGSREEAAKALWEWMCEQWPDSTGTVDELTDRLLDLETGDQIALPSEFRGGGWIALSRLRVRV